MLKENYVREEMELQNMIWPFGKKKSEAKKHKTQEECDKYTGNWQENADRCNADPDCRVCHYPNVIPICKSVYEEGTDKKVYFHDVKYSRVRCDK